MASRSARSPRPLVALAALIVLLLGAGWYASHRPAHPAAVLASALPPEARETLALIAAGGPFPFREDGEVFTNREGLLPAEPSG